MLLVAVGLVGILAHHSTPRITSTVSMPNARIAGTGPSALRAAILRASLQTAETSQLPAVRSFGPLLPPYNSRERAFSVANAEASDRE